MGPPRAHTLPQPFPGSRQAVFQPTPTGFRLAVTTGRRETQAAFFPRDENILDNPAPQTVTPTATGLILELKKDPNLPGGPCAVERRAGAFWRQELRDRGNAWNRCRPCRAASVFLCRSGAHRGPRFLGGLLLNLMPCVFPVLFLKGLALVQFGSEERHKLRAHGFVYAIGILVSFWALVAALLASARRRRNARLGIPVPVAGISVADGRAAVLPRPFARRPV